MEKMIELKNITKEFKVLNRREGLKGSFQDLFSRDYKIIRAVDDISLSVGQGEIVGFLGPNGAGKSTTIKMMTGVLEPTSGELMVNGRIPYKNRTANSQEIGVVFGQRTQLWWDLPLSESYTILKEIYDVPDADYKERMEFLNEVLDLPDFFDRPVRTLSLGQRMRADLGAALIHNPKVLYLDEPTIGLDLVVKDKIREAIRVINEKYHTTVILTTHDIGDIEELCSRIIVIDEGHKIYDGGLGELKDTYGTKRSVIMEVRSVQQAKELNWKKILHADPSVFVLEGDEENNQLMISFDKNDLQVSDVISAAMGAIEVRDIKIQETELSEIVKEIYRHQLNV